MGLSPFGRNCSSDPLNPKAVAPDPSKWTLIEKAEFPNGFVLKVHYDGCTNYEGNKIMVYEGHWNADWNLWNLDPHFKEISTRSPIARFRPTERGWDLACFMAESF